MVSVNICKGIRSCNFCHNRNYESDIIDSDKDNAVCDIYEVTIDNFVIATCKQCFSKIVKEINEEYNNID